MNAPLFVTGIGTEIGKTVAAAILVEALKADYWKPVQSGDLDYTDSHKIEQWTTQSGTIHPEGFRLNTPMSPHESARIDGVKIALSDFRLPTTTNGLVVEGAGGLLVPLNEKALIADLIPILGLEVVLVVRHYLGSINHTLLSISYLKERVYPVKGIIFNGTSVPSSESAIEQHSPWPVLGRIEEAEAVTPAFVQKQAQRFTHLWS